MALSSPLTVQPYDFIGDPTGRPLNKGRIYIGEANKDPEFYPIAVYFDQALTKEAIQPIRTNNGFVDFAGSLAELYASEDIYSVKVLDEQGRKIVYKGAMMRNNLTDDALSSLNSAIVAVTQEAEASVKEAIDAVVIDGAVTDSFVSVMPQYTGAIPRAQAQKNREVLSVEDFGAKGNGVENDAIAIQAAINAAQSAGLRLFFPSGTYPLSGIDLKGVSLVGDNAVIVSNGDITKRYLFDDNTTQSLSIQNITFDGTNHVLNSDTWQRNLHFRQNTNVSLRNVDHINCKGTMLETQVAVKSVNVSGGLILGCTDAHGMIIRSTHNTFNDITFKDCAEHVIRFGRFNSDADVDSGKYSVVSNCSFSNIGNDAVLFELNSSYGTVTNCVSNNCRSLVKAESTPTLEYQKAHHIVVTNNICNTGINEGSAAIKLNSCKNCVISGNLVKGYYNGVSAGENSNIDNNIIENTEYTAIVLSGNNSNVTNNKIISAAIGIGVAGAANTTIANNTIKGCTTYAANISSAKVTLSQNNLDTNAIALRLVSTATEAAITLNRGASNTTILTGGAANSFIKNNFGDLASINTP